MTRSLPLGASLRAAVAFVPKAWVQAPGALVLLAAVLAFPCWGAKLALGPWTTPAAIAFALVVYLAAEGALYRLGVAGDAKAARALGLGPLGLQLGAAELRLLASQILVGLFLSVVLGALCVVLAFVAMALEVGFSPQEWLGAPEGWRSVTFAGFILLAFWVMLQLGVRLSLCKAATVARRRIVSVSALGLSEHNFWRLLSGSLVAGLPTLALLVWRAYGGGAGVLTGWVLAVAFAFVQAPLIIGFVCEAYKRLEYWRSHPGEG
jgi:hypothetical protein